MKFFLTAFFFFIMIEVLQEGKFPHLMICESRHIAAEFMTCFKL